MDKRGLTHYATVALRKVKAAIWLLMQMHDIKVCALHFAFENSASCLFCPTRARVQRSQTGKSRNGPVNKRDCCANTTTNSHDPIIQQVAQTLHVSWHLSCVTKAITIELKRLQRLHIPLAETLAKRVVVEVNKYAIHIMLANSSD